MLDRILMFVIVALLAVIVLGGGLLYLNYGEQQLQANEANASSDYIVVVTPTTDLVDVAEAYCDASWDEYPDYMTATQPPRYVSESWKECINEWFERRGLNPIY